MTPPRGLIVQIVTDGFLIDEKHLDPDRVTTFGRGSTDISYFDNETSSRHQGSFVATGSTWWLVVPRAREGEQPKSTVRVRLDDTTVASVDEGGALPLHGRGVITPVTDSQIELHFDTGTTPPDDVLDAIDPARSRSAAITSRAPQTDVIRPLSPKGLDYILTAGWFAWNSDSAPILTVDQIAAIWSTDEKPVQPDSVRKTIDRALDAVSNDLGITALSWSRDARGALNLLKRLRRIAPLDHAWLALDFDHPDDIPNFPAGERDGPRPSAERPAGWRPER